MTIMIRRLSLLLVAMLTLLPVPAAAERVRDLGQFQSVRSNQLTGYGVVVGLDGSGDDNFAYVTQAMRGVSGGWACNCRRASIRRSRMLRQ